MSHICQRCFSHLLNLPHFTTDSLADGADVDGTGGSYQYLADSEETGAKYVDRDHSRHDDVTVIAIQETGDTHNSHLMSPGHGTIANPVE